MHHPAAEADRLAEPFGDPRLDRRRLGDADAVPDDGPGRGLVGGPEPHRAQSRVPALDVADHRVALAHRGKSRAVDVEREDPLHLRPHLRHQVTPRVGRADDLSPDGAGASLPGRVPAVLPHPDADRPPAAFTGNASSSPPSAAPEYDAGVNPSRNLMLTASENGPCGTSVNVSMLPITPFPTDISAGPRLTTTMEHRCRNGDNDGV